VNNQPSLTIEAMTTGRVTESLDLYQDAKPKCMRMSQGIVSALPAQDPGQYHGENATAGRNESCKDHWVETP
jgi:hypothetical protein